MPGQRSALFSHANVAKNGGLAFVILVNLGTRMVLHLQPGKAWAESKINYHESEKNKVYLDTKIDGYVISPSSSLLPHNGAKGNRPENGKLWLQKAFLFLCTQS